MPGGCSAQESYLCSFSKQTDLYSIGQVAQGNLRARVQVVIASRVEGFSIIYIYTYIAFVYVIIIVYNI